MRLNNFLKKFNTYSTKTKLGRWNMDDMNKTELKIFYANEDHCGVCVESPIEELNKSVKVKDNNEEYYKAFIV